MCIRDSDTSVLVTEGISFSDVQGRGSEVRSVVHVPGEDDFDLWFKIDGAEAAAAPEAFVALALPVAMARGIPIESPGPLSEGFAAGIDRWQAIFHTWY